MFRDIFVCVATAILLTIITNFVSKLGQLIKALIRKHDLQINQATVDTVMSSFKTALTQAIIATNQTFVNDLKANGQFDKEAMTKAMKLTTEYCKKMLAEDVIEYLELNYDDVDSLIEATAETIIGASKNNSIDTSAVVSTIIEYLSKMPNAQQYTMQEITAELRKQFNITT